MKAICMKRFVCENAQSCEASKVFELNTYRSNSQCKLNIQPSFKKVVLKRNADIYINPDLVDTSLSKVGIFPFAQFNANIYEDENGNQLAVFNSDGKNICLEQCFTIISV